MKKFASTLAAILAAALIFWMVKICGARIQKHIDRKAQELENRRNALIMRQRREGQDVETKRKTRIVQEQLEGLLSKPDTQSPTEEEEEEEEERANFNRLNEIQKSTESENPKKMWNIF